MIILQFFSVSVKEEKIDSRSLFSFPHWLVEWLFHGGNSEVKMKGQVFTSELEDMSRSFTSLC